LAVILESVSFTGNGSLVSPSIVFCDDFVERVNLLNFFNIVYRKTQNEDGGERRPDCGMYGIIKFRYQLRVVVLESLIGGQAAAFFTRFSLSLGFSSPLHA
jgi:hypothetical protein